MLRKTLLFLIFIASFTVGYTQEPQFKFYLAFEDAKQERDTVWCVVDSSASGGWNAVDTTFGERWIPFDSNDSNRFQVYFSYYNDSLLKTFASPFGGGGGMPSFPQIEARKYSLPIIVHWDTILLLENNLPFSIAIAWLNTQSPQIEDFKLFRNEKYPDCDSLVLDSFMIGGGWASHFPIKVSFFKGGKTGLESIDHRPRLVLYPIPSTDYLMAELPRDTGLGGSYKIMDLTGGLLMAGYYEGDKIDLTGLSAGYYILSLTTPKHQYHEIFSKN